MNTPRHPEDERAGIESAQATPRDQSEAFHNNPYANQYQRSAEPDLDAGAPALRSNELRQMNRRALFLLGAVVLLLLFLAFWLISGAGKKSDQSKPREEKVTVAEAPASLALPQLPPAPAPLPAAQPIPLLPAPTPAPNRQMPAPSGPTLLQRRLAASSNDTGTSDSGSLVAAQQSLGKKLPGDVDSVPTSAQPLTHPDTLMQRGTYIRCVLETRIVSDIPGFSTCLVTEPVYSFNGHSLLLPKGSKLLGSYSGGPTGDREAVIWDRIITPTGIDVNMSSPGIDNLGGAGVPGYYDAHWGKRIGSALLISLLSDAFKYEAAEHGPRTTSISNGVVTQTPFESNTAQTIQNLANQAVREAANRPPTVTINQGTVIYVYVTKDVDFSGVVARS
ncbi:TrbI/VirB10 family protein [Rhodanobacter glycinis]|uniref:TrbI/VirB10 family protein n=1 Tax=Rhodanobacter glycinis TaxID=582702 RepID=UPI001476A47D|nr:TrbI/VirB10 family protein [Rhodanobacter glycinis]